MPEQMEHKAFVLVGPTAVGKTTVAHWIARQDRQTILSADSMLVYEGMDIGTAKPDAASRNEVCYWGMDLVTPAQDFSVGDYVAAARRDLATAAGTAILAVGGTGLYVKCLMEGLDELPASDPDLRSRAQELLNKGGVPALQDELRRADAHRYESLKDKNNPRRLIRALELAAKNAAPCQKWGKPVDTVVGLRMPMPQLAERIRQRVQKMFDEGLLDEVQQLREQYPAWSKTARHAIGYLEAQAVLDGQMTQKQAVDNTIIRTRQLAKRQMTWFRHQLNVDWIDATSDMETEAVGKLVLERWKQNGPSHLAI